MGKYSDYGIDLMFVIGLLLVGIGVGFYSWQGACIIAGSLLFSLAVAGIFAK